MNLKYRLIVIFSLMTVIPLFIMFIMAAYTNYHAVDTTLFETRLRAVNGKAALIQKFIDSEKSELDVIADCIASDPAGKAVLLNLYKKKHPEWEYLYFVNAEGQVTQTFPYTDFQGDNDFSRRQWFNSIKATHQPYMSDTIISSATKATTFFIAYPVVSQDGTFHGVVGINFSLNTLNANLASNLHISQNSEIILVDKTSGVLTSNSQISSFTPDLSIKRSAPEGRIATFSTDKTDKVAFYTTIPGTDWTIFLIENAADLYEANHNFLQKGILLLALAIILAIFCSYYLAKSLTKPLNILIDSIDANSDEQKYSFIDISRGNKIGNISPEIQKLADSLNNMISALSKQQSELKEFNHSMIETIITLLEINDRYTVGHSHNVSKLSVLLAEKLSLSSQLKETIAAAALLHDIGKIGVNTNILNKPGTLTPEEYDAIKKHPFLGFMALQSASKLTELSQIILAHHERYDGKGYPNKLQGDNIPFLSRIICVADAFDAMYSDRPYRQGLNLEKIISIMEEERGRQFDPSVVDALLELIQEGKIS